MRPFSMRAAVSLAVLFCANWSVAQESSLVSPLIRTTIAVDSIEASLPLYRDILGLSVWRDMTLDGPKLNEIIGTEDETIRIVILQSQQSDVGNVALLEYLGQKEKTATKVKKRFEPGDVALVMNTTDIQAIYKSVQEAGYTIVSAPTVLFHRENMVSQTYEMMFISPDGIFINVIQRGVPKPQ